MNVKIARIKKRLTQGELAKQSFRRIKMSRELLYKNLDKQVCPECGCRNIGVDNWGMFKPEEDWFYYCKNCDITFNPNDSKNDEEFTECLVEVLVKVGKR